MNASSDESVSFARRRILVGLFGSLLGGCAIQSEIFNLVDRVIEGDVGSQCSDWDYYHERCGVTLSREEIAAKGIAATQEMTQWCWAACIQMAFRWHGYELAQERIVRAAYGRIVNLPAFGWTIHRRLAQSWRDDLGSEFRGSSRTLMDFTRGIRPSPSIGTRVRDELEKGYPLIIGTGGHAMLLVAQEAVQRRSSGRVVAVNRIAVLDPWPFRFNPRELKLLSFQDVNNTIFLATIDTSPI